MGLFNNLFGKNKKSDFEKALEYVEKEYRKQEAKFNNELEKLNDVLDKKINELNEKIAKTDALNEERIKRIESCLNINQPQEKQMQMQNAVNEYYRIHPATPEEEKEAEEYLRHLMENHDGRSR